MSSPIDWDRAAADLQRHVADLLHGDGPRLHGDAFSAEALRRTFGYVPPRGDGSEGDRDQVTRHGLTTTADADWVRGAHTVGDRMARERAEAEAKRLRGEAAGVRAAAATELADYLRQRCNPRSVPSKYRREGVAWAADMIDPRVPKDRYGSLPPPAGTH